MPFARRFLRQLELARSPVADQPLATVGDAAPAVRPPGRQAAIPVVPRRWRTAAEAGTPDARPNSARMALRGLSFLLVVALPVAVAGGYYFGIAADQYVGEFRFTLSSADPPRLDPLSQLVGTTFQSPAVVESQVLVQYIGSRAIVDEIDASLDLRRFFSPPQADWWARLALPVSIEELVRYWKGQVDPFYDPATGTVTVQARAFAAADALQLSRAIVAACEKLVNELSSRARQDALARAETELAEAQTRLTAVLSEIRTFRDREGLIDPGKSAEAAGLLQTRVRDELLRANAELATLKKYMRDDAPSVKVLTARIRALETQRRLLARELTSPETGRSDALSRVLGSYEQLESERKFAEAAYQLALRGVDQARANADRQHVFIASFVPPSLPEEALYPRRWRSLGTVALIAFAVWGIGGLAAQSIRDHLP